MWFASFLMSKKYKVESFDVIKKGKGRFYFDVSDEDWKELKLECSNSIIQEIKLHQITLKDMVH